MERLSHVLAGYVISKKAGKKEDYEIYQYGFQVGMEVLLCVTVSLIIAALMGKVLQCLGIMIALFWQRAYVDGIHMKHFRTCFLLSCSVILGGIVFVEFIRIPDMQLLLLFLSCLLSVHLLRFIKASKGKWDKERKFFFQKRCRMIFLLLLLSILFYFGGFTVGLQILFYTEAVLVLSVFLKTCKDTRSHRT